MMYERMISMKKIVAVMLAVITLIAVSVTSFSAEVVDSEYGAYSAQTDVSYEVYSTYDVTVPTFLTYGQTGRINVTMSDIAPGYHIEVAVTNMGQDGTIPLYSDVNNFDTQNGKFSLRVNGIPYEPIDSHVIAELYVDSTDTTNENFVEIGFDIAEKPTGAGTYGGMICLRFDCINY